jgi:O-antigen/teichoic acid export membrane protein
VVAVNATGLDEVAEVDAHAAGPVAVPRRRFGRPGAAARRPGLDSDTAKAVGLAAATMAANLLAVVFTIVFTRLLGAEGYGSLAALLNLSIILFVPGSALQVAAAREGTLGRLGHGGELAATLSRWMRHLLGALVVVVGLSVLAREPLAALLNVEQEWAAAAVPPTALVWLILCVQRGLLQAAQAYKAVGLSVVLDAGGRLLIGLVLVGAGLGVTGAYLGTFLAFALAALALELVLRRHLGPADETTPRHPLRALARDAAIPIAVLTLVAGLQNLDVILAKHALDATTAGVYAAATVAAKATVWIAFGLGFWVLPEATRRAARGEDPRTVLVRALAVIGAIAAVALTAYAVAPGLVLRTAFGPEFESGETVLFALGAAYALLAASYLGVQYLLGLHHRAFAPALGLALVVEAALLAGAGSLTAFAGVVLAIQAAVALVVLTLSARARTARAS